MSITQHPNSILNSDVVAEWAVEDRKRPGRIQDRALRAAALLPEIEAHFSSELPRAKKAVELWRDEALPWLTAVLHKDGSTSIFHFWAQEWIGPTGKYAEDVIACMVCKMTVSKALEFLNESKAIWFPNL